MVQNETRNRNNMIISIEVENAFDKNSIFLHDRSPEKKKQ
jgi:hypothetical protein